jgi:predicted MFS family arabinose efflux permease
MAAIMRLVSWRKAMLRSTPKDSDTVACYFSRQMASKLPLLALLIAVTCLSQFYRVSNSVIAPELARDLNLSARQLGWAGSAFFFALFAVQIPVGMWFDRFGARRTVAALSLLAMLGSLWIARAADATDLIAGRAIVGIGCAASFMSVVFLCSRWFQPAKLATVLSCVFAASNIGTLAAATPLAWIAATVGWRHGFLGLAALTLVVAIGFFVFVRDRPPEARGAEPAKESPAEILRGLWEVWRTPGLGPVLSMHFFAYATMLTVLGVWGGPYLYDVHKLDGVQRGNVLLAMGVAQILGILAYGPMDRVLRSRKKVVFGGAAISMVLLVIMAALANPPLWLAVALLIAFCFFCAYGTVIVAQGRLLFPDRLAGRGVTTVNMAQCLALAVLPAGTGYIVEAFGASDLAYRWVFATLAAGLALGSIAYTRARDSATLRG